MFKERHSPSKYFSSDRRSALDEEALVTVIESAILGAPSVLIDPFFLTEAEGLISRYSLDQLYPMKELFRWAASAPSSQASFLRRSFLPVKYQIFGEDVDLGRLGYEDPSPDGSNAIKDGRKVRGVPRPHSGVDLPVSYRDGSVEPFTAPDDCLCISTSYHSSLQWRRVFYIPSSGVFFIISHLGAVPPLGLSKGELISNKVGVGRMYKEGDVLGYPDLDPGPPSTGPHVHLECYKIFGSVPFEQKEGPSVLYDGIMKFLSECRVLHPGMFPKDFPGAVSNGKDAVLAWVNPFYVFSLPHVHLPISSSFDEYAAPMYVNSLRREIEFISELRTLETSVNRRYASGLDRALAMVRPPSNRSYLLLKKVREAMTDFQTSNLPLSSSARSFMNVLYSVQND